MPDKKPKQKSETIGGIDFVFQHPGIRQLLRITDQSKNKDGVLMSETYYKQIMEHVIVAPKTDWDFWDEHDDILEEVMGAAVSFLGGGTRDTNQPV